MAWSLFETNSGHDRPIQAEVLKTYWRLVGPTQRPITCALYRTGAGLELRTYRDPSDLLYRLPVSTEHHGAHQAASWKAAAMTFAGFADADATPAGTHNVMCADCRQTIPAGDTFRRVAFGGSAPMVTMFKGGLLLHPACYRRCHQEPVIL